jgi:hypothetical protein
VNDVLALHLADRDEEAFVDVRAEHRDEIYLLSPIRRPLVARRRQTTGSGVDDDDVALSDCVFALDAEQVGSGIEDQVVAAPVGIGPQDDDSRSRRRRSDLCLCNRALLARCESVHRHEH